MGTIKKVIVLSFIIISTVLIQAESFDFSTLSLGKWKDNKYMDQWIFLPNDLQIKKDGKPVFGYNNKIRNLDVKLSPDFVEMTLRNNEWNKNYAILKDLRNTDFNMSVDRKRRIHFEVRVKIR